MLSDRGGGVDGHLIARGVAVLHRQIEIEQVNVEIGMNELVFYELPDDTGHLVAVDIDDGVGDLDFAHGNP